MVAFKQYRMALLLFGLIVLAPGCEQSRGDLKPDAAENLMPEGPNGDFDQDGYTPARGDCNDSQALINPDAVEIVGNGRDDDCNGHIDEPFVSCDTDGLLHRDALSLARAMDLCDSRFFRSASLTPNNTVNQSFRARRAIDHFGRLQPISGASMVILSTGIAADKSDVAFLPVQPGFEYATRQPNPAPNLVSAIPGCPQANAEQVFDYTELTVRLHVPSNARSLAFNFHFMSAEYPEFVCTPYNDKFLVAFESDRVSLENIAVDDNKQPITVNSGFFSVCNNYSYRTQTQKCTRPITDLTGTGYEDNPGGISTLPDGTILPPHSNMGGSTGWLTTKVNVNPKEDITLRFIIFDDQDFKIDSTVLIDSFRWSEEDADTVTIPIM